ncbi:MAG: SusC/RagA family TonB-linked outer membrane protein, partial [Bacteroidetes bacterium QH_7_62_13]
MLKRALSAALFALAALGLFSQGVFAQEGRIAGTVVDSTTSRALPGVNVVVEGTQIGAATDSDGSFRLTNVPVGTNTLNVSFVGYRQKEVSVNVQEGSTTDVRIRIVPSRVQLEDVVVTAMGQERNERAVATSVQKVEGASLAEVENENFINSLSGRVSGASVRSSSTMGGSSNINIRGVSSLSGNNQPLIVVDGIVVDNSTNRTSGGDLNQAGGYGGYDYGNAAQSLNPSNIESISVLKGPSAAALYGSRGADGVIQITTKGGSRDDELGVTYSSSVQLSESYELMDYQNKYGGGAPGSAFSTLDGDRRLNEQVDGNQDQLVADYATDESWGPRLDGREVRQWYSWDDVNGLEGEATPWEAHPDNIENFLRTGTTYGNNLAVSQGQDNYNYRLSLNSRNTNGVMPNSSLDRYQVQFNGSLDLSDRLTATAVAKYSYEAGKGRSGTGYFVQDEAQNRAQGGSNPFAQFNTFGQRQYDLGPDSYMRDYERPNGDQRGWNFFGISGAKNGEFRFTDNPYVGRFENFQTDDEQRIFGKAELGYDLTNRLTGTFMITSDHRTERRQNRQ